MNKEVRLVIDAFRAVKIAPEDVSDLIYQSKAFSKFISILFEDYEQCDEIAENYNLVLGGLCVNTDADDYDLGWSNGGFLVRNAKELQGNGMYSLDLAHPTDWTTSEYGAEVPAFKAKPLDKSLLYRVIFDVYLNDDDFRKDHMFDGEHLSHSNMDLMLQGLNNNWHIVGHSIPYTLGLINNQIKLMQIKFKVSKFNDIEKTLNNHTKTIQNSINDIKRKAKASNQINAKKARKQNYQDMKKQGQTLIKQANRILDKYNPSQSKDSNNTHNAVKHWF